MSNATTIQIKITAAAKKSIASGIRSQVIRRSSGGQICQEGFAECEDGKVLKIYQDRSEPIGQQVRDARVSRLSWRDALNEATNS